MKLSFAHSDPKAAPWQPDELVTVRILSVGADGSYEAETVETYAPDIKQRHLEQIEGIHASYARILNPEPPAELDDAHE